MSRRRTALFGAAFLVLGFTGFGLVGLRDGSGGSSDHAASSAEEMFLADLDLKAGNYTVLLHPLATGDRHHVVRDADVIRRAAPRAFYAAHRTEQNATLLASVFFLSPPGQTVDEGFVTIARDKTALRTHTCYIRRCAEPDHRRELAGLLDASEPVELVQESFAHHAQARSALFRALRNPNVAVILPPDLPRPSYIVYPHRFELSLPPVVVEIDLETNEPLVPFDESLHEARFRAALAYIFPDPEAYRITSFYADSVLHASTGWPIVSDRFDSPLRREDGTPEGLRGYMIKLPQVTIEVIPALASAFQQGEAFAAMPAFTPRVPTSVSTRLDALAEQILRAPCLGCFDVEWASLAGRTSQTTSGIYIREIAPVEYSIQYYRILDDEPAAQQ